MPQLPQMPQMQQMILPLMAPMASVAPVAPVAPVASVGVNPMAPLAPGPLVPGQLPMPVNLGMLPILMSSLGPKGRNKSQIMVRPAIQSVVFSFFCIGKYNRHGHQQSSDEDI